MMNVSGNYVDDGRVAAECMAPRTKFSAQKNGFILEEPEEEEDCVRNLQSQVLNALNGLVTGLKFTEEDFSDFDNGRLETLDFAQEIGEFLETFILIP